MSYVTVNVELDEVLEELSDDDLKTEMEERGYYVDADYVEPEDLFTDQQIKYLKALLLKQDHYMSLDARECYEVLLNV